MEKFKAWLRQPEIPIILFVLGLIAFVRPLLLMVESASPSRVLIAIYLPWALLALLIFWIAQVIFVAPPEEDTERAEEVMHD